ncbi:class I SAM-dependent methyltransferase [Nocardia sp. NPDC051030]|uniref:class I SAM-dependent DNA methyltransferase n=1 Tax=Nocardia sp. NPDC051030 TaxID=3155162 RepID=UPI003442F31D
MTDVAGVGRVRDAYDAVAELYNDLFKRQLEANPFDRAVLDVFAESTRGEGVVADLGCGPGRVTGHLKSLGLNVFGVDLSPEMIRLAREQHPDVQFEVGSMDQLKSADGALAGIVAWYSIIHTSPEQLPTILAEFARVLRPGGHVLLGFQASDERDGVQEFDHKVTTGYRWAPDTLADVLGRTGFQVTARLVREPRPDERFQQATLFAVRD